MGREEIDKLRIGSVKAAIDLYGQKNPKSVPEANKSQMHIPKESSSKTRELHMAREEVRRHKESRRATESAKNDVQSELSDAKRKVKYLTSLIEASKLSANKQWKSLELLKKTGMHLKGSMIGNDNVELLRELVKAKQELSSLKFEMASLIDEKSQVEKNIEVSNTKALFHCSTSELLRKKLEEVNEELVLVELAHIEAKKELNAIEAQREKDKCDYLSKIEETRRRMNELAEEVELSREIEAKLASTMADVEALKNELELIKKLKGANVKYEGSNHSGELADCLQLKAVADELEAAKKELNNLRKECFESMASMDITRNVLKHILEEIARLKKMEEEADLKVQNINSKLLRAKDKLEAASASEENANSLLSDLSSTLKQCKQETETAKRDRIIMYAETESVKAETKKMECEINSVEERLKDAMDELEAVKSSESVALENLQNLSENIVQNRNSESQRKSSITISKFEYEYLTGRAVDAEEISDKKIAAALAWIGALQASEKELSLHIEIGKREIRQLLVEEEQEINEMKKSLMVENVVDENSPDHTLQNVESLESGNRQQKSSRRSGMRTRIRISGSPAARPLSRVPSVNTKQKKVVPGLAKIFSGKGNANNI